MRIGNLLGHPQIISLVFTLITFAFSLLPKTLTYGPSSSYVNHRLDMRQCVSHVRELNSTLELTCASLAQSVGYRFCHGTCDHQLVCCCW